MLNKGDMLSIFFRFNWHRGKFIWPLEMLTNIQKFGPGRGLISQNT